MWYFLFRTNKNKHGSYRDSQKYGKGNSLCHFLNYLSFHPLFEPDFIPKIFLCFLPGGTVQTFYNIF